MWKKLTNILIPIAILLVVLFFLVFCLLAERIFTQGSFWFLPLVIIVGLSVLFIVGHLLCVYSIRKDNNWWLLGALLIVAAIVLSIIFTLSFNTTIIATYTISVIAAYLIFFYFLLKE